VTSHRQIFRSSSIIGAASVINIVFGIVRVKVLAVMLGPVGVGLMGLYQNIMGIASTLAGCGVNSSSVRQLAASVGEAETLAIVRRALWLGNITLGIAGMVILWLLRESVAMWVFGDTSHAREVGWLGLGLLLTLIAGSQTALLQGLRRISDMALVSIISGFVGASLGILAISLLRENGIIWFVLTAPAVNMLVVSYYTARLPRPQAPYDLVAIQQQWLIMLKLGIPLMAASLLTLAVQLAVRSIVLRELGLEASGYFQAALVISMSYIGFVLSAMSTDYYPRLTAAINEHERARKLVNEQAEMALLLTGPVLLSMITLAPWVIHILYAESFGPAAVLLRWQVLGDIIKIAAWPMGFIIVAAGRGSIFIGTQLVWNMIYLGVVFFGIHVIGLTVVGVGYWLAYLIGLGVNAIVTNKIIGFELALENLKLTLMLLIASGFIMLLSSQSVATGYVVGLLLTLVASVYSFRRLDVLLDLRSLFKRLFNS